jgi:Plasmid pRiA4b ORF-3-like protein
MATTRKAPLRVVRAPAQIYQLRIELQYLKPAIWRRVLVPGSIKLSKFHVVILWSMGWQGGHMHEFVIGQTNYGEPDPDFPQVPPVVREDRVTLQQALGSLKTIRYIYDFGDDWEHKIKLEKTLPFDPEMKHPRCIAGQYACPPEDVGGVDAYIDFLDAIRNPAHEEHASMLEWIGGGFDPLTFDLDETNERLSEIKL